MRARICYLSHGELNAFLNPETLPGCIPQPVITPHLPEHSKVVRLEYDVELQRLGLVIVSDSFEDIPDGAEIPEIRIHPFDLQITQKRVQQVVQQMPEVVKAEEPVNQPPVQATPIVPDAAVSSAPAPIQATVPVQTAPEAPASQPEPVPAVVPAPAPAPAPVQQAQPQQPSQQ